MNKTLAICFGLIWAQSSWPAEGEVATHWAENAMDTVRGGNLGTPDAARLYAMVTIAMYDAVNGIDSVSGGMRQHALVPPAGAPVGANRKVAAAAAAHTVLSALAPDQRARLDTELSSYLRAHTANNPAVLAGRQWGESVGQRVLLLRAADGSRTPVRMDPGTAPGAHRAEFDSRWRNMMPFGIASKTKYVSPPPPNLMSPEYANAFRDVKEAGTQDCDPARNEIGQFWLAEAGTARETGIWLQAAVAIARQKDTVRSLSETARLLALVAMSVADSVIVSWDTKARYFTWRPAVAIREASTDGNAATMADPSWRPRYGSPGASPEYNSGTSTFGGAASRILEQFYSRKQLSFCFKTDNAQTGPRCFDSPLQAAEEAGRSRILQGIHFQFSNEDGRRVGRAIGDEIVTTRLR